MCLFACQPPNGGDDDSPIVIIPGAAASDEEVLPVGDDEQAADPEPEPEPLPEPEAGAQSEAGPEPEAEPEPDPEPETDAESEPDAEPEPERGRGERPIPAATRQPAPERLVAVGDVHGDLRALVDALDAAQVIDDDLHWSGGETVVVQVGDQLDRGDDERAILDYLEVLADEAHAAGGAVHALLGNHETMNVAEDFRYVTDGGWDDFDDVPYDRDDRALAEYVDWARGRVAAFRPGGLYATVLAGHNVVMVVGDTVFVHGGLLPDLAEHGIERANREVQAWMHGSGARPGFVSAEHSPVWSRHYSQDTGADECAMLAETLRMVGAARMVVAHTVQPNGISSACDGRVFRVDVGLSAYYGGPQEVLELRGERVRVLAQ